MSLGVAEHNATHIFDLMEKFAGYGFNKSHSAAYALLSYQTAWLKAHYPAAFMSAVLSADMDHTDKVVTLVDECSKMDLALAPPDVNESLYTFSVSGVRSLRYGLGAIKGVGQGAVQSIIDEREAGGQFEDLVGFCSRVDLQKANKRVLEALIKAGALDRLGPNRATLMQHLPLAIRRADQHAQAEAAGQSDLFGMPSVVESTGEHEGLPNETLPDWSDAERLAGEKETLGLYLTGHPIEAFVDDLAHLTSGRIADLSTAEPQAGYGGRRDVIVAGLVLQMRRRGNRVTLVLDDRSGRIEVTLFDETFQACRNVVATDAVLVVEGSLRFDDFIGEWRVTARRVVDIDQAREEHAARLLICWDVNGEESDFIDRLRGTLQPFREGKCPVSLVYTGPAARARIALGEDWCVRPSRELIQRLGKLVGGGNVRVVYGQRGIA
jgi:DNA polymerase-3 subunit alpha